jgi:hypothetical protein
MISIQALSRPSRARQGTTAGAPETNLDEATVDWMQTVLNAWATACQRHLRTRLEPPPWTIFYDVMRGI